MKKKPVVAIAVVVAVIVVSLIFLIKSNSEKVLCRHIVLSQYATFVDAGYEAELWHMKNKYPEKANGFKYHIALRVRKTKDDPWEWVDQPSMSYTTSSSQPKDTELLRQMKLKEVVDWVPDQE